MRMPVMLVVGVAMLVLERLVHVFVLVRLGEMQVEPDRHQKTRKNELQRHGFTKQGDRDNGADEWCRREIGTRARGAEMAETEHKQDEADAITDKADDRRAADRRRGRKLRPGKKRQDEVHRARGEPFDQRDLYRVGGAETAG